MAPRALPGLGLTAYWGTGASGWDVQHDPDTRLVSILCQCRVQSRTTALPGSPTDGDLFLVPADDGSNPNELAARDDGAWVYLMPSGGFMVYVEDESSFVVWDSVNLEWVPVGCAAVSLESSSLTLAAGLPCGARIRMDAAGANAVSLDEDANVYYPTGFWFEVEQVGAGQTSVAALTGVTVNTPETLDVRSQFCVVKVMKVGADEWTLSGDVAPV